jgi:hypothetical protein
MFADKTRYMISEFSEKGIVPDSCLTYDDQLPLLVFYCSGSSKTFALLIRP